MKKNKKSWWFWMTLIILFVVYCGLIVAMESGYYESKMNKRTVMTEDKIKEFESDIKNGKYIDIDNYLIEEKEEYNNGISRLGLYFSSEVERFMSDGISESLKIIGKLFGS